MIDSKKEGWKERCVCVWERNKKKKKEEGREGESEEGEEWCPAIENEGYVTEEQWKENNKMIGTKQNE